MAAACGLVLDEWQALALDVSMGELPSGRWAASDVDIIASRQNGKNGAVEARELYGATIIGESIIHTAHHFKTTKESYNRLLSLVEANPDVADRLTWKVASPASGYEMRFRGGGRVLFIARSRTSGRGLTGDVLVLDEAQDLDDDALGALLPTISSGPMRNRQAWYLGSAPGPLSVVWNRRRSSGRKGESERRAFFEFSADPDCDLDDRAAWAQANPALGRRLMEDAIEAERAAMSDEMFARERLSVSPELDVESSVFPGGSWPEAADPSSQIVGPTSFALDVSPDGLSAAIAAAGNREDGLQHGEVIDHRPGVGWVVARLVTLSGKWGGTVSLDPAGPAGALVKDLDQAGVLVEKVTARSHAQACQGLVDAVVDHRFKHLDQPELNQAVRGAAKRTVGDAWMWARRSSSTDICPLVAVTLARWAASSPAKPPAPPLTRSTAGARSETADLSVLTF